ncbi:hypothetical protein BN7_2203 [Wickerhamomyces ciferrii]|uniref:Uncharacterized protein n=1 Tax=Wickerhamomyces ciferrii (strain ATCC 14091 / BCRC 22168 / CBS 111 / JCM 3599 / NBRC 0793 / NRRL Y-1031 F-60-10) TaxID=1206466 RepID=K0KMR9_WICCF|nr:uncharacterized protein BN7_2203 [Wickerhamomyces ciferrii]CCH42659.1 hypothetical protein BN7_2203 [Wickerhamomyces ciferrii]
MSGKKTNQDSTKGLEYKNLIKEKILKPSKSNEFQFLRKHHSHLVIRDSNYFNKNPTCFIACASCHRGRVLKISYIQEKVNIDILNEIYTIIGANPCSKKRAKSNVNANNANVNANVNTINPPAPVITNTLTNPSLSVPTSTNKLNHINNVLSLNNDENEVQKKLKLSNPISIPKFEEFFQDIDLIDLSSNPLNFKLPINSINSFANITNSSLISIQKGDINFPSSLDLLLSLSLNQKYPNFQTKDTLIIPLPVLSNTKFHTTFDESLYLQDLNLQDSINLRISNFINSENFTNLNNLKIFVLIVTFQEGQPTSPQEDQTHKYVGKIILYSDFINNELMNNQLIYQTKKFFLNHDYTFIDSKFEWYQTNFLQKILIQPLQKQLFNKYKYPIMGETISTDVFINTSMSINVPYIINASFYQINYSNSLFIVVFLINKILKKFIHDLKLENLNEINIMNSLQGIEYNNQFNIYTLKLVLDNLNELYNKI